MTSPPDFAFELIDVAVSFGGLRVLDEVDLQLDAGEVLGLIGPNGAGKTTLFNIASGLVAPSSGRVLLAGADITAMIPERRARLGLARTFQRLETFRVLSVRENVQVAVEIRNGWARTREPAGATADALLDLVGIGHIASRPAGSLPTGMARLLEVARALAIKPSVLLLDEPASGLDSRETTLLGQLISRLAGNGLGVLLVEHDISVVMDVCHRIAVLDGGRVIADGLPHEVRDNADVQAAYLGPTVGA